MMSAAKLPESSCECAPAISKMLPHAIPASCVPACYGWRAAMACPCTSQDADERQACPTTSVSHDSGTRRESAPREVHRYQKALPAISLSRREFLDLHRKKWCPGQSA